MILYAVRLSFGRAEPHQTARPNDTKAMILCRRPKYRAVRRIKFPHVGSGACPCPPRGQLPRQATEGNYSPTGAHGNTKDQQSTATLGAGDTARLPTNLTSRLFSTPLRGFKSFADAPSR